MSEIKFITDNGLPYPNWKKIYQENTDNPERTKEPFYTALIKDWVPVLLQNLGQPFELMESETTIYYTYFKGRTAKDRFYIILDVRKKLLEVFGNIVPKEYVGKQLIIEIQDSENYYKYISHYFTEKDQDTGEVIYPQSAGCMVSDGYMHIVLGHQAKAYLSAIIAHELTHIWLAWYRPPLWLNEGVATNAEAIFTGAQSAYFQESNVERAFEKWTADLFESFLSGELYKDYKATNMCYRLSFMTVRNMIMQRIDWLSLLQKIRDQQDIKQSILLVTGKTISDFLPGQIREDIFGPQNELIAGQRKKTKR